MSDVIKLINQRISHFPIFRGALLSYQTVSIYIMWIFTISALIGIGLGYSEWFIPKTPLNLLVGLSLLFVNVPLISNKGRLLFFIAFMVGMSVEIAGVISGQIFGIYEYGNNLGFKVFGVPIMIGIYWAVLVIVTSHMSKSIFKNIIIASIFGALLMIGLDFLMEQMASRFDFWHFEHGIAPLQNYIAWFIVAFSLQILAYNWLTDYKGNFCFHLYLNQVAFFAISFLLLLFQ